MGDATRSQAWFGLSGKNGFIHRSWMKGQGLPDDTFDGRPVIGIANSASELVPCNVHLSEIAAAVKRGVWEAGGLPLEFPTMSLGESLMRPTTMLFRNLMAMGVEETIRANPLDGVVLLSGCDKTTPAMVMAAASVDLPAILITGGPKLSGRFKGQMLGSGTHLWEFSEAVRAGRMSEDEFRAAEICMSRSNGHCMTMGTASTMACVTEALGLQLPGAAAVPAVDSRRLRMAHAAGRRLIEMVRDDLRPSRILTRNAFENAIKVNAAIGGSTNAVIHLLAMAGRAEIELELSDFDDLMRDVPLLVDLMPSGEFLMEDFFDAGGLPAVMDELGQLLDLRALTVTGRSLGENIADASRWNQTVIRDRADPVQPPGRGTAVLRGNLAPRGAVIKQSAASERLMTHTGRALVFDSLEDYERSMDDPNLDCDPSSVLVLRYAGPRGYPGMPEVGNLSLPRKLLEQGVEDMVRISDARMSGTSYGTVILHAAPEAAAGGPLAFVRTGDRIELDVKKRTLRVDLSARELDERRSGWTPPDPAASRGWERLYVDHVLQADRGCDLDFLTGRSGAPVPARAF